MLSFILGILTGVVIMCIVQINKINEYEKKIEEEYK